MKDFDNEKERIALINGKKVLYDACSKDRNSYQDVKNNYMGKGTIYSIDGVVQTVVDKKPFYHFFRFHHLM